MLRFITKATFLSAIITVILTCYIYPQYYRLIIMTLKDILKLSFKVKPIDLTTSTSTPVFGLKVSFILVSFYLVQGIMSSLTNSKKRTSPSSSSSSIKSKQTQTQSHHNKKENNSNFIPVHFLEIPLLVGLIVSGISFIPPSFIKHYLSVLSTIAPILPILELFSIMTIIMESGKILTPIINDSSATFKICILFLCLCSYIISCAVFIFIYGWMNISTVTASLLSSILTFILVQTVACCKLEHATITDLSCIFMNISYNLLLITFRQVRQSTSVSVSGYSVLSGFSPKHQGSLTQAGLFSWLKLNFNPASSSDSSTSTDLASTILKQIIGTFISPALIFHLILQLAILVLTTKQDSPVQDQEPDEGVVSVMNKIRRSCLQFSLQKLWPYFGKLFLVLIYTISWIDQFHPEIFISTSSTSSITSYLVSFLTSTVTKAAAIDFTVVTRWMVIFGAIAWYSKHLLYDSHCDEETTAVKYSCDKNYWKQFHDMK